MNLWNLKYWETGEYQVIQERYDDLRKEKKIICPQRKDVFRALKETPYDQVKVAIFGQDPYPNPQHATGIAFSIPSNINSNNYPPTLQNLLKEYTEDLHYPTPSSGDISLWCNKGVLLWNVIPSCNAYQSLSHDWVEWEELNKELISLLNTNNILIVFLGTVARRYQGLSSNNIYYSHPSPRANISSKSPFLGSRLFSTINSHLRDPVDWKLP